MAYRIVGEQRSRTFTIHLHIEVQCERCKSITHFLIPRSEWIAWKEQRKLIQDALISLTAGQRELLISDTCEKCFDALFSMKGLEE